MSKMAKGVYTSWSPSCVTLQNCARHPLYNGRIRQGIRAPWMSQEVIKRLVLQVGYNPNISHVEVAYNL